MLSVLLMPSLLPAFPVIAVLLTSSVTAEATGSGFGIERRRARTSSVSVIPGEKQLQSIQPSQQENETPMRQPTLQQPFRQPLRTLQQALRLQSPSPQEFSNAPVLVPAVSSDFASSSEHQSQTAAGGGVQLFPARESNISMPLAEVERPHPSVARIVAFDHQGQQFGSGTLVETAGHYGIVITNWHVINGADGLVHVHFPNGFASYGAVIAADEKWDLAAIAISNPSTNVPRLPIATSVPRPGDALWIVGYGAGVYRIAGGRCLRYLAPEIPQNGRAEYEYIELSIDARQGDSGGPILNDNGEIAGVLFGSDKINTAGSHSGRVRLFLQQAMTEIPTLPPMPETYFAMIEEDGPRRQLNESARPIVVTRSLSAPRYRQTNVAESFSGSYDSIASPRIFSSDGMRSGSRRYSNQPAFQQQSLNDPDAAAPVSLVPRSLTPISHSVPANSGKIVPMALIAAEAAPSFPAEHTATSDDHSMPAHFTPLFQSDSQTNFSRLLCPFFGVPILLAVFYWVSRQRVTV